MVPEEARSNNKRQKDERTIYCLPSDIIERVFLTLPFSTLLRCARVCKQWRNFIHDPEFVASQLQHAPRYALLFFPQETVSRQRCPSDAILVDEALSQSTCAVLCLHLEKPVKNLRGDHFSLYTFGFHPASQQYKITHFLRDCTDTGGPHNNDRASVIQVYTLGDEKWKDIRTPIALNLNNIRNSGVVNNDGTLYWLTEDMIANCGHAVMSFDVSEEIFARIQLPAVLQDCAHGDPRRYWIREIDGKMCIATAQTDRYVPRWLVSKIHVWTLVNKSEHMWNHKYNIQPSSDFILGPNFVHWDRIIMRPSNGDVFASELSHENSDINFSKTVMLLNFSPRKHNLQSHNCVKSLVRLDVFKKAGIVRRPKQWEGWELKKWQFWEQNRSKIETMWCKVHQEEHKETAFAQSMHIELNRLLPRISDDAMRQYIGIKIDQVLPAFSNQQARPLRQLNWVEHKRDMDKLIHRLERFMHITMAMANIGDMIRSATQDQKFAQSMRTKLNLLLPGVSDDMMRQHIHMKINQTFPAFSNQQARPLQRLSWLVHKRDMEKITNRLENFVHITMAMAQVIASVGDMIRSATQDQGNTISEAGIASQIHCDGVDTDLRLGSLSRHSP
ncbi:hypothetical protein ACQ4PT_063941 [Festuca glaucescens]